MAKAKRREESSGGIPAWLTTYSDLMTLMFSFFVILISFSTFEKGRIVRFVGSFVGAFKILPGGFKTEAGDQVMEPGKEIIKTFREPSDLLTRIKGIRKKEGLKQGVEFRRTNRGLEITIADYLLFGLKPGSASISPEMKPFLDELAQIIKETSYMVQIEGHTDDSPDETSRYSSSWELSAARAVAVLRYLVEERGVSPLRIKAAGFGQFRPLAPSDTPDHQSLNRRVEIYFLPNELKCEILEDKPLYKEGLMNDQDSYPDERQG